MNAVLKWNNNGAHSARSDYLNDTKESITRARQSRPTMYTPPLCYARRCAEHHPVRVGTWSIHQLRLELADQFQTELALGKSLTGVRTTL